LNDIYREKQREVEQDETEQDERDDCRLRSGEARRRLMHNDGGYPKEREVVLIDYTGLGRGKKKKSNAKDTITANEWVRA